MEMAQITALIGAAASLLCTLVVGALTYFVKQTLNDFRKADERNAQKCCSEKDLFETIG